jgi:hypothetical protein
MVMLIYMTLWKLIWLYGLFWPLMTPTALRGFGAFETFGFYAA